MAKRFTDSEKWSKPFIRSMKAPYKLLWLYILDECNHAGIWQVDMDVARVKIGEKLYLDEAIKSFEGKIYVFDNGEKWFIPDFIEFQYGVLNQENRAHNSVIQILCKYNLIDIETGQIKPLISPLQGAMDKDKDMDKDISVTIIKKFTPPTLDEVESYFAQNGYTNARKAYEYYSVADWHDANGKKIKNWKQKMQGVWFKEENKIAGSNGLAIKEKPDMTGWTEKQIYIWRTKNEEKFADLYRSAEANQFIASYEEKTGRYKDYFDQQTLRFKSNQE